MTPRERPVRLPYLALLLALVWVVGACGPAGDTGEDRELTVPDPDVSAMDPALARWLRDTREQVARRAAESTEPTEAGKALGELGQLYYVFDRKEAAAEALEQAVRLDPESYRWSYLLANALAELGRLEDARDRFEATLELRPDSIPARVRLGDVLLDMDRPAEAAQAYARAVELDEATAAAHFGLGRAAAAQDDSAAAAEHFERALELQPGASAVRYPLAQAYRELGRMDDAERQLAQRGEDAVRLDDPIGKELGDVQTLTAFQVLQSLAARPEGRTPEELLGFALTQLGDVQGTADQLEAAIRRRETADDATPEELGRLHYLLGALRVQEGEDRSAAEALERALELTPDLTDAQIKLGNALARQGRFGEAADLYSRALKGRPDDRDLRTKRATAWINAQRFDDAAAELERLLAEDPLDPTVHVRLAEARELSGRPDDAERRYRQALELSWEAEDAARVHRGFGDFHRRNGNLDAAVDQYRQALDLDPDLGAARRALAGLLGYRGDLDAAARQYAEAANRNPEDAEAWQGEAMARLYAGDLEQARTRLGEAVSRVPTALGLRLLLARLLSAAPDARVRDGVRALELAGPVYDRRPSPAVAETVAMALAEQGRFDEAVQWQERAVQGAGTRAGDAWARLTLYRSRRPFRAAGPEDYLPTPPGSSGS